MPLDGEESEELLNLWPAEVAWVLFLVVENEAANPVAVGVFRALGVVAPPHRIAHLIE